MLPRLPGGSVAEAVVPHRRGRWQVANRWSAADGDGHHAAPDPADGGSCHRGEGLLGDLGQLVEHEKPALAAPEKALKELLETSTEPA